jgi:hypothetical protein
MINELVGENDAVLEVVDEEGEISIRVYKLAYEYSMDDNDQRVLVRCMSDILKGGGHHAAGQTDSEKLET